MLLALAVTTLGDNQLPELFDLLILLWVVSQLWKPILIDVGYISIQVLNFRYVIISFELPLLDRDVIIGLMSSDPPINGLLPLTGLPVLDADLWFI